MAVLHDYECAMHGGFEAYEAKCPYGCRGRLVQMVFLKAVGTKSESTKHNERETRALADTYGLSDIKRTYEGESQMDNQPKKYAKEAAAQWVGDPVPYNSPGWASRGEAPKTFDISSLGGKGASPSLQPMQKMLPKSLPTMIRKE